jgi:hypothetical protein
VLGTPNTLCDIQRRDDLTWLSFLPVPLTSVGAGLKRHVMSAGLTRFGEASVRTMGSMWRAGGAALEHDGAPALTTAEWYLLKVGRFVIAVERDARPAARPTNQIIHLGVVRSI